MNKSQSIQNIAKALQLFHLKCDKIKKDSNNPFFKSKYASLPNILEQITEPLNESGLTFTQFPDGKGLTTILMHVESGEFMEANYEMNPAPEYSKEKDGPTVVFRSAPYITPQATGSAITYARRYALSAILGLITDEDDDGNKGSGRDSGNGAQKTPDTEDKREWLNPGTPKWTEAIKAISGGSVTMAQIEKKYRLSATNKASLINQSNIPA